MTLLANKERLDLTTLARDIADSYKPGLGAGRAGGEHRRAGEQMEPRRDRGAAREAPEGSERADVREFDHDGNAARRTDDLAADARAGVRQSQDRHQADAGGPSAGLDLPIHVSIWEDDRNRVWVGYRSLDSFAAEHAIKDPETVAAMSKVLDALITKTVNVYDY